MNINDIKNVFNSHNQSEFIISEKNYRNVLSGEIENCNVDIFWYTSRYGAYLEIDVNLDNNIVFRNLKFSNINITNIYKVYSSKKFYEHSKPVYVWCKNKEYADKILKEGIVEMLIEFFDPTKLKWEVILEDNLLKIKIHYAMFKIIKKDFYNNLYNFLKNFIKKVNDDKFYPSNLEENEEEIQNENNNINMIHYIPKKILTIFLLFIILSKSFKWIIDFFVILKDFIYHFITDIILK